MKFKILIGLILTFSTGYSQITTFKGVYKADWGGPSFRYLFLNCDSTYQFVTDWDFQVDHEYNPPKNVHRKWSVEANMNLIFEEPPFEFKSLAIQSDGTLVQPRGDRKTIWHPIGKVNTACQYDWMVQREIHREGNYTVNKIKPGTQILESEVFISNQLVEKRAYYILTDVEIEEIHEELNAKHEKLGTKMKTMIEDNSDPIKQLEVILAYLDMFSIPESIEKTENGVKTISYFDKKGVEIKK